jgi:hypothetical protein
MYHLAIRQFVRSLKNLDAILGKAVSYADARKFDVNNFVTARLFPDMLPLANQVRIATDMAKATAANLGGKEAPKFEDNEKTVEELRARVRRCISFLESFSAADFEKVSSKTVVKVPFPQGKAPARRLMVRSPRAPSRARLTTPTGARGVSSSPRLLL